MRRFFDWIPRLWSNPLSLVGTVITTVSAFALIVVIVGFKVAGVEVDPFAGTFFLVGLPALFILGLILIPIGLLLARRKGPNQPPRPLGEAIGALFTTSGGRRALAMIALLTVVNVTLVAAAGHRVVTWTSDPTFCGTTCHGIMEPEWESYRDEPHGQVACVKCHVGLGGASYVRSKIDGLRQVWKALRDDYTKPVAAPVHSLPPASETCMGCHFPDRWTGDRPELFSHTAPDEANSELVNVMVLKVGGHDRAKGTWSGFHWHAQPDLEIRYESYDASRTSIGKVTVLKKGAVVEEFLPPEAKGSVHAVRSMDCTDCHNRPTHRFALSVSEALDHAFAGGTLDRSVKWLRETAEPLLTEVKRDRAGVQAAFRSELEAAYREKHADAVPDGAALDAAAKGLATVWRDNVFPDRAVAWGTYPNHLGHQSATPTQHGCFRCHDDKHKTAAGKVLSGECEVCHEMVAQDEARDKLEESVRQMLGIR